jgi:hypothetical protein
MDTIPRRVLGRAGAAVSLGLLPLLLQVSGCAPDIGQDPNGIVPDDMPGDDEPEPPAPPPPRQMPGQPADPEPAPAPSPSADAGAPPDASPPGPDAGAASDARDGGAGDTPPAAPAPYDPVRAKKLADTALAMWNGKPSRDLCLKGVGDSAERSGIIPTPPGWLRHISAAAFQRYYNMRPAELAKRGFRRETIPLGKVPLGSLIGWRPGQCGYHATYGHIEIVVDRTVSRACSDYCGAIKKTCGDPYVYIPIKL